MNALGQIRDLLDRIPHTWCLVGLGLIPVVPTIWLAQTYGFKGLFGQDPYAYYDYAVGPLLASLKALHLPPPFFWPPGYPLIVALFSSITGPVPLAGQIVSLIAGAAIPILTALFAAEVWPVSDGNNTFSLLAGLLAAFTGQLWQSSIVVMADTTALAAATAGMWALARYGRRVDSHERSLPWLLIAVTGLAYAVLTRWAYGLVVIPATIYTAGLLIQMPRSTAVRHAVSGSAIAILILSPILVSLANAGVGTVNQPQSFTGDWHVAAWHPSRALSRTHHTIDGLLTYRLPNGLYYALAPVHKYFFTPLLALFILPGLWLLLRKRRIAPLLLVLGWPAAVYIFHAGWPYQNFRFTMAYLPPFAVLSALGIQSIHSLRQTLASRWLPVAVVAGLVWMGIGGWTLSRNLMQRHQMDLETIRWVERQIKPGARLFTFSLTPGFAHATDIATEDLFLLEPEVMADYLRDGRPHYLFLDIQNIETQWAGKAPATNFHWLEDHVGPQKKGSYGDYTLFRLNASLLTE